MPASATSLTSDADDVMQLLNNKLLPDDLVHTKGSLEQMLQYVAE